MSSSKCMLKAQLNLFSKGAWPFASGLSHLIAPWQTSFDHRLLHQLLRKKRIRSPHLTCQGVLSSGDAQKLANAPYRLWCYPVSRMPIHVAGGPLVAPLTMASLQSPLSTVTSVTGEC